MLAGILTFDTQLKTSPLTFLKRLRDKFNLPETRVLRHVSTLRTSYAAGYLSVNMYIFA